MAAYDPTGEAIRVFEAPYSLTGAATLVAAYDPVGEAIRVLDVSQTHSTEFTLSLNFSRILSSLRFTWIPVSWFDLVKADNTD